MDDFAFGCGVVHDGFGVDATLNDFFPLFGAAVGVKGLVHTVGQSIGDLHDQLGLTGGVIVLLGAVASALVVEVKVLGHLAVFMVALEVVDVAHVLPVAFFLDGARRVIDSVRAVRKTVFVGDFASDGAGGIVLLPNPRASVVGKMSFLNDAVRAVSGFAAHGAGDLPKSLLLAVGVSAVGDFTG